MDLARRPKCRRGDACIARRGGDARDARACRANRSRRSSIVVVVPVVVVVVVVERRIANLKAHSSGAAAAVRAAVVGLFPHVGVKFVSSSMSKTFEFSKAKEMIATNQCGVYQLPYEMSENSKFGFYLYEKEKPEQSRCRISGHR